MVKHTKKKLKLLSRKNNIRKLKGGSKKLKLNTMPKKKFFETEKAFQKRLIKYHLNIDEGLENPLFKNKKQHIYGDSILSNNIYKGISPPVYETLSSSGYDKLPSSGYDTLPSSGYETTRSNNVGPRDYNIVYPSKKEKYIEIMLQNPELAKIFKTQLRQAIKKYYTNLGKTDNEIYNIIKRLGLAYQQKLNTPQQQYSESNYTKLNPKVVVTSHGSIRI